MTTYKAYSEMTAAEKAAIDADEDRREARKAGFVGASDVNADLRVAFAALRTQAGLNGFTGNFKQACINANDGEVPSTPEAWVAAAETVYNDTLDGLADEADFEAEYEGPGITEPCEVAYGPRGW